MSGPDRTRLPRQGRLSSAPTAGQDDRGHTAKRRADLVERVFWLVVEEGGPESGLSGSREVADDMLTSLELGHDEETTAALARSLTRNSPTRLLGVVGLTCRTRVGPAAVRALMEATKGPDPDAAWVAHAYARAARLLELAAEMHERPDLRPDELDRLALFLAGQVVELAAHALALAASLTSGTTFVRLAEAAVRLLDE